MQLGTLKAIGLLACLLILGGMLAVGTGCGGSEETTAPSVKQLVATKDPSTPHARIAHYMKQQFGSESWYPLITDIEAAAGGSVAVVETKLTNHKTPHWNEKQAEIMCRALLEAPGVKTASVLWDARTTYEAFSC